MWVLGIIALVTLPTKSFSTTHVEVFYHPDDAVFLPALLENGEKYYRFWEDFFGFAPQKRISIFLLPRIEEAGFHPFTDETGKIYLLSPSQSDIFPSIWLGEILRHEMGHSFLYAFSLNFPEWFLEGVAGLFDKPKTDWIRDAFFTKSVPITLEKLPDLSLQLFSTISASFLASLYQEKGSDTFRRLFSFLREGENFSSAWSKSFGKSPQEQYSAWWKSQNATVTSAFRGLSQLPKAELVNPSGIVREYAFLSDRVVYRDLNGRVWYVKIHPKVDQPKMLWSANEGQEKYLEAFPQGLIFSSNQMEGEYDLWMWKQAENLRLPITRLRGGEFFPAFRPFASVEIAFVSYIRGNPDLYLFVKEQAVPVALTEAMEYRPRWNSNGTYLFFISESREQATLIALERETFRREKIPFQGWVENFAPHPFQPVVYFIGKSVVNRREEWNVFSYHLEKKSLKAITIDGKLKRDIAVAPDGSGLLLTMISPIQGEHQYDLFWYPFDTLEYHRLTSTAYDEKEVSFFDEQTVFFLSGPAWGNNLYRLRLAGK